MKLEALTIAGGLNESDRELLTQFLDRFTVNLVPKEVARNPLHLSPADGLHALSEFIVSPDGFLQETATAVAWPVPMRVHRPTKATSNVSTIPDYVFRKIGCHWEVAFAGGTPFHLLDSLGVRYLGHLFHHPNQPISSFDLETTIMPQKAAARSATSIHHHLDAKAIRDYQRRLNELRAGRQNAVASSNGDPAMIDAVDVEIAAPSAALKTKGRASSTLERARVNVCKAISAVRKMLLTGNANEMALGEHIAQSVHTGYQCIYAQPAGRIWA